MDAGLRIKELAAVVGATEDSVINWELRGVRPIAAYLGKVVDFILEHSRGHVARIELMRLLFLYDLSYPAEVKTLGDKLRATRMESFLTIEQVAQELGVNECTVRRWELGGSQPSPEKLERVVAFLESSSPAVGSN